MKNLTLIGEIFYWSKITHKNHNVISLKTKLLLDFRIKILFDKLKRSRHYTNVTKH